ncbi:hypothetical protein C4N94_20485 [Salmonella enterica]|nr:hypothetical protein [Salmonella enterica]EBW9743104.1 hypothetical protein [Salmonella enterica subsp. enterica serovar Saintpaul]
MKIKINQLPVCAVIRPEHAVEMTYKEPALKEKICGAFYRFFYVWTVPMIIFTLWLFIVIWAGSYVYK